MSDDNLTFQPDYASPPGNTLRNVLEELGMTQAELAARGGWSEKFVSQIINAKASITADTALKFERILGTPASFWMNREANYRETLARLADQERLEQEVELAREFPYDEMAKRGWVEKTRDRVEQVLNLQVFFRVGSLERLGAQPAAIFRVGRCSNPSDCAIIAWLQAGRIQAEEIETGKLDRGAIRAAIPALRELTLQDPHLAVQRLRDTLAGNGVALALVPALSKTAAQGATHWARPDKAVLQLSDRYKRADIFWFSFFHEVCHLLKHDKRAGVYVNLEERGEDPLEDEADRFAADTLIAPGAFEEFVGGGDFSAIAIRDFADAIGIHPGIVVGRLQYEGLIPYSHLNTLREEFDFAQLAE